MADSRQTGRVHAVDVARGIVMALMVVDHVRVYAAVPSWSNETAVFLTRWVTHFCAPTFLFLAGVSIFLSSRRRDLSNLSGHLAKRGLGLVIMELVIVRTAWTFNLGFDDYLFAGVIWAIGWSMVLMSALIHLPKTALAIFALGVIAGHDLVANLLELGNPWVESYSWPWRVLYTGGLISIGESGPVLVVVYSVLPWTAIMAAGFCFGRVFAMPVQKQTRICWTIGAASILAFCILRGWNLFGDPRPWTASNSRPTWMEILSVNKYSPSFLFVLMTLGPVIALLPYLDRVRGRIGACLTQFGRLPLFFYLIHIPLIHLVAILISLFRTPDCTFWLFGDHPVTQEPVPQGYTWGLPLLYGVAAICLVALFHACRIYENRKRQEKIKV